MWCRGAETPAGLAFAAGHLCAGVLRSLVELSLRRRHVTAVSLPESCWSLSELPTQHRDLKLRLPQATASGRGSVPFAPCWAYSGRMVDTRIRGVGGLKRGTSLRDQRHLSGALQTRGRLYETSSCPAWSSWNCTAKRGCRRGPRPLLVVRARTKSAPRTRHDASPRPGS